MKELFDSIWMMSAGQLISNLFIVVLIAVGIIVALWILQLTVAYFFIFRKIKR